MENTKNAVNNSGPSILMFYIKDAPGLNTPFNIFLSSFLTLLPMIIIDIFICRDMFKKEGSE